MRAANQSGGKDNITVVLFRFGDGDDDEDGDALPGEDDTIAGQISAAEVQAAAAAQEPTPAQTKTGTVVKDLADAPPDATVVVPPDKRPEPAPAPAPRRRRGRLKRVLKGLFVLVLLGAVVGGLYALCRQVYFVGTNDAGLVTLYRGVPYELPFGDRPLRARSTRAACPRARSRPAAASGCSTTSGAAARTPWTWCAHSSAGSSPADVGPHPRAVRADAGVAAGGGGLRRRAGHAHRGRERRHAHLRRRLPRACA